MTAYEHTPTDPIQRMYEEAFQEMSEIAQDQGMHPDRINAVADHFFPAPAGGEEGGPYTVKPYGHGFEVQGPAPDGGTHQVAQIKRHPNATEEETRERAEMVARALNLRPVAVVQWRVLGDDDDTVSVIPRHMEFDPLLHSDGAVDQDDLDRATRAYDSPGWIELCRFDAWVAR